jgi:hypothetical protein
MPEEIRFVHDAFWQMSDGRPLTQGGFLPIPNMEILAWSMLNGVKLKLWEMQVIRVMDRIWLKHANKRDGQNG